MNNMQIEPKEMRISSNNIKSIGKNYTDKITDLYNKMNVEMAQVWEGQEYEQVKAKFATYKTDLEKLGILISETIPKDVNDAANNYEEWQRKVNQFAKN